MKFKTKKTNKPKDLKADRKDTSIGSSLTWNLKENKSLIQILKELKVRFSSHQS